MNDTNHPARLLCAHGSRGPLSAQGLQRLAEQCSALSAGQIFHRAFLEHSEPLLEQALDDLCQVHNSIIIHPVFLFQGLHAGSDIPRIVESIRHKHPRVEIQVKPSLGATKNFHDWFVDNIQKALQAAMAQHIQGCRLLFLHPGTSRPEVVARIETLCSLMARDAKAIGMDLVHLGRGHQPGLADYMLKQPVSPTLVVPLYIFDSRTLQSAKANLQDHFAATQVPFHILPVLSQGGKFEEFLARWLALS